MNKFESSPVTKAFRKQAEHFFPGRDTHFICGVSGGVDSMCLLYLLHRHLIQTTVVHCNYMLRGADSEADQEFVEQICALWNIDCITAVYDPQKRDHNNTQAWARELRYQAFRDLKTELNAGAIITAHHQDDQIETILQKILRGAGLPAWKGMDYLEGDLFRPLLDVSKKEIRQFVSDHEIPFREDRTNLKADYARNFLRLEWAPAMDELFPGWRQNMLKIPERASNADLLTEELLSRLMPDRQSIDREQFLSLNRNIKPVVLSAFVKKAVEGVSPSAGFLAELDSLEDLQTGAGVSISEEYRLFRDRNRFIVQKTLENERSFTVFGKDDLEDKTVHSGDLTFTETEWNRVILEEELMIDSAELAWPVTIRNWRDGDKIQPLGMKGTQLVSDLLTNNKIRSGQKKSSKIVQSFDGNVSAVIFPHITNEGRQGIISERFKCTKNTRRILKIFRHDT